MAFSNPAICVSSVNGSFQFALNFPTRALRPVLSTYSAGLSLSKICTPLSTPSTHSTKDL